MAAQARFWIKPALAAGLIVLADQMLFRQRIGSTVGLFALALALAAALAHPAARRRRRGRLAFAGAAVMAVSLLDAPNTIGWLLFCIALGVAVLSPRAGGHDGAWAWGQRLAFLGAAGLIATLRDFGRLSWISAQRTVDLKARMGVLVLPLAGGGVFLSLFALANPVIAQTLAGLWLPEPDWGRIVFWLAALACIWPVMRPAHLRRTLPLPEAAGERPLLGVSPASVTASLALFNLIFAIENGLDIAFLWSRAPLPAGVTLADYAHKGAYTLILAALLAGLFVLVALRPGSASARSPWTRRLVVAWVAQTLVLTASSMLRVIDYVQAYALTELRVAALVWMGLVAVGLMLICWRLLFAKSAAWLVNANVAAALAALFACSLTDIDGVVASWNVTHAREAGGSGEPLDLCYLENIGMASLVPLSELETRPLPGPFHATVDSVRGRLLAREIAQQGAWRGWSLRGALRLRKAQGLFPAIGPAPLSCDGEWLTKPKAA